MKTNIRDTSIETHDALKEEHKLSQNAAIIYALLVEVNRGMSYSEIGRELGWGNNCITSRIAELRDKQLVVAGPKRPCSITGRNVYPWQLPPPPAAEVAPAIPITPVPESAQAPDPMAARAGQPGGEPEPGPPVPTPLLAPAPPAQRPVPAPQPGMQASLF